MKHEDDIMCEKSNPLAFTLTELVVTIVSVAAILVTATSLFESTRDSNKNSICLSNLQQLNSAVRIYTEQNNNVLPNPMHPAIYRHQTLDTYLAHGYNQQTAEQLLQRQLSHLLRGITGDNIDRIITCPTVDSIATDEHFKEFSSANSRTVFSTNYVLNNYTTPSNPNATCPRGTDPANYFGSESAVGGQVEEQASQIGQIPNPTREWMIADAWYRVSPVSTIFELQQEGPYQSAWSGEALPYFAPHSKRGSTKMYTDPFERRYAASRIHQDQSDGLTNTLFFDGHAAAVPSRTFVTNGFEILYGFPGTVNPELTEQGQVIWDLGNWK